MTEEPTPVECPSCGEEMETEYENFNGKKMPVPKVPCDNCDTKKVDGN